MKKRLLAMLMAVAMMLSLLPTAAFAAGTPTPTLTPSAKSNDDVTITKTAAPIANTGDQWKVTMTIDPEKDIDPQPLELVLVLDVSGSMNWCTQVTHWNQHEDADDCNTTMGQNGDWTESRLYKATEEAKTMLQNLQAAKVDATISIVTFAGNGYVALERTKDYAIAMTTLTTLGSEETSGGTYVNEGLKEAYDILFDQPESAVKAVVLLGDGVFNGTDPVDGSSWYGYGYSTPGYATAIKGTTSYGATGLKNTTLYTIAFAAGKDAQGALARVASPKEAYVAGDAAALQSVFAKIASKIVPMVNDNMTSDTVSDVRITSTPTVNGTSASNIVANNGEELRWNAEDTIDSGETVTIVYDVTLKDIQSLDIGKNTVDLNGTAKLSYSVGNSNKELDFPRPQAVVNVGQLVEEYYLDNVKQEELTVTHDKVIVNGTNAFAWNAGDDKISGDVIYVESKVGDDVVKRSDSIAATGVQYVVKHYYSSKPIYTVTYNDGVESDVVFEDQVTQVKEGDLTPEFKNGQNPERTGYTFKDWNPEVAEKVTGNVTYKAVWEAKEYTVTYKWSGLPTDDNVTIVPTVSLPGVSQQKTDAEVTVDTNYNNTFVVREKNEYGNVIAEYTFSGWKTNDAEIGADNKFTMPAQDVTLTGEWIKKEVTPDTHTVTYKYENAPSDAPALPGVQSYQQNQPVTVASAPSLEGWTFDGWYNGDKKVKNFNMPGDDVVLVGSWTRNTYNVAVQYYYDSVSEDNGFVDPTSNQNNPFTVNSGESWEIAVGVEGAADYKAPKTVTKDDVQYAFDPIASDTLTGDAAATVKLVYGVDNNKDEIPDKYQKKVTFKVVNGKWNNGNTADVIKYVTLTDEAGKWAINGKYTVTAKDVTEIPGVGDVPNPDYKAGNWDKKLYVEGEKISSDVTYIYTYVIDELTIVFNANGGFWSADVDGYVMNENDTTASKTYLPSAIVAEIDSAPAQPGKVFNGWYIEIDGQKEFVIWQKNIFPKAQLIKQYGGVVYADWADAPVESLTYTVRQHYIDADGEEVAAVNVIKQTADKNTEIASLISSLEKNQTYYNQNYVYVASETTVSGAEYKADMKLTQPDTVIDLYYYLDEWKDTDDVLKGGDTIPDYQQAVVTFRANPNGNVGETGQKTIQVYTLKAGTDGTYSDSIIPTAVTPVPDEGYAFDLWTKNEEETSVNPFVSQTLSGGDYVTYVAHFAVDVKGDPTDPENKGDKIPDKYQKKVTFKVVNGKWNNGNTADVIKYVTLTDEAGKWAVDGSYKVTAADVSAIPAVGQKPNSGYRAAGSWDALYKADDIIKNDVTYTYTYAKKHNNNNGDNINDNDVPLNTEDHFAYIIGYPDGNVKPAGNITRAEVATIFFRLLTDEARDMFWSTENEYSDVAADQWFNNAISTLSNAGIINGYEDGSFRPNNPITRAEFAKIAASFFTYAEKEYQGLFSDVPAEKWYALFVEAASDLGLVTGYEDGTFRPEQFITRAESCTIVNRTIDRHPHEDQLHEDMVVWPDNPAPGEAGHMWYYEQVQEATNSHDYEMKDNYENWTEILENRDWGALEKEWSDSNSAPGGEVMQ